MSKILDKEYTPDKVNCEVLPGGVTRRIKVRLNNLKRSYDYPSPEIIEVYEKDSVGLWGLAKLGFSCVIDGPSCTVVCSDQHYYCGELNTYPRSVLIETDSPVFLETIDARRLANVDHKMPEEDLTPAT